jgi:hypothetical protein
MLGSAIILCNGISIGIILFQTAVIAPTVFKGLSTEQASPFLRLVFPKFFIFLALVGVIIGVLSAYGGDTVHMAVGALTTLLAFTCYTIIPSTNKARDEGNDKRFRRLHRASVGMTLVILLANSISVAV